MSLQVSILPSQGCSLERNKNDRNDERTEDRMKKPQAMEQARATEKRASDLLQAELSDQFVFSPLFLSRGSADLFCVDQTSESLRDLKVRNLKTPADVLDYLAKFGDLVRIELKASCELTPRFYAVKGSFGVKHPFADVIEHSDILIFCSLKDQNVAMLDDTSHEFFAVQLRVQGALDAEVQALLAKSSVYSSELVNFKTSTSQLAQLLMDTFETESHADRVNDQREILFQEEKREKVQKKQLEISDKRRLLQNEKTSQSKKQKIAQDIKAKHAEIEAIKEEKKKNSVKKRERS